MDPQAPSQPNLDTVYDQPSNPAQSTSEHAASTSTSASLQRSDPTAERRKQGDVSSGEKNAMPSAMGYGARDASGDAGGSMGGPVSDLEGEQMRAPGEGDIASAQDSKHGFGEQGDLASDLDRKKDEQAKIKESRGSTQGRGGVDVGAAIGGRDRGFVGGKDEDTNSGGRGTGMQSSHAEV